MGLAVARRLSDCILPSSKHAEFLSLELFHAPNFVGRLWGLSFYSNKTVNQCTKQGP